MKLDKKSILGHTRSTRYDGYIFVYGNDFSLYTKNNMSISLYDSAGFVFDDNLQFKMYIL